MLKVAEGVYRGPHVDPGFLDIGTALHAVMYTLDLESGKRVIGDNSPLEEQLACSQHGIRCWAHPLGAFFAPTLDELRLAVDVIKLTSQGGVYVHCKKGVDRTGMVIAAYRILVEKWKPFDAMWDCIHGGMHPVYYPWLLQLWRL